jgi:hypothetical protein
VSSSSVGTTGWMGAGRSSFRSGRATSGSTVSNTAVDPSAPGTFCAWVPVAMVTIGSVPGGTSTLNEMTVDAATPGPSS